VGSLLLRGSDAQDPEMVLRQLLTEIRNEESRNKKRVAA
jgi:hypothetical protein